MSTKPLGSTGSTTSVRLYFHYSINTIANIKTYISTSLSLNLNLNIDSQPLKIPPDGDCKVEKCRVLTKDKA